MLEIRIIERSSVLIRRQLFAFCMFLELFKQFAR